MWNTSNGKDSFFITLYTDDVVDRQYQQLLLNGTEMWLCCIMQTLPATCLCTLTNILRKISKTLGWRPLERGVAIVATSFPLPEDQRKRPDGRDTITSYQQSTDPDVRKWAVNHRDALNQLRNAPALHLWKYYEEHIRILLERAREASTARRECN